MIFGARQVSAESAARGGQAITEYGRRVFATVGTVRQATMAIDHGPKKA